MRRLLISIIVFFVAVNFISAQKIKVEETKNYSVASKQKLAVAVHLLDSILLTNEFRTQVLKANFVGAKGKTNLEIYNYLISGNTKFESNNDSVLNFYLAEYPKYAGGNEIGVTKGKITSTHRCFILENDVRCLSGHLIHEYFHVMGFGHHNIASERPKSQTAPYVIGRIVKKMLSAPNCPAIKKDCFKKK